MKKSILVLLCVLFSTVAFADSAAVKKAADTMKSKDVRTVLTPIENKDGNPCLPPGKSFNADLQVKKAVNYDRINDKIVYSWETVKTINIDPDGRVSEICAE